MLFVMGLAPVVTGLCGALGLGDGCWLAQQMRHVSWHGFAQHDTIFPLFLFIAGVALFVLAAGSYSLALMAVFYWIVDVKMWRRWTFFLRVVGMNAITVYLLQRIVDIDAVARFFVGGVAGMLPAEWSAVLVAAGHLAVCWLVLLFLYRKNVFLKV